MTQEKKTIYLFFGEDTFSISQKIGRWKQEFEKKFGDINIQILEGRKLEADEFAVAVKAAPFLSEKRLVIIEDFLKKGGAEEQKKIADILEKAPDTCIVAFVENEPPDQRTTLFKKLKKIGQVEEFHHLTEPQIIKWILDRAHSKNAKISPRVAAYLASLTGPNLWNLENELEKLTLYCKNREVKENDIDELVKPALTSSIFKLTDHLAQKDRKRSLKTLNILRDSGSELMMILFMIVRHFRILIQVCDLIKKGCGKPQITAQIKEHPYTIQIALNQCRNFDAETLKKIYRNLHELDIAIKTGKIRSSGDDKRELILAMEKFILEVCK